MADILAENIAFDENGLYIPQTWLDGVGEGNYTPMTADRMNHIEQGIKGLSDAWDSQYQWLEIKTGITGLTCRVNPATREGYLSFDAVTISNYGYEHDIDLPTEYRPKEIFSTALYCSDNGVTGWARIKPSGKVQYVNLAYNDHAYGQLRWNF